MTAPEDLRYAETAPEAHRRLIEIAAEQSRLAAEASALIAAMAGAPDRVADRDTETDHRQVDAPSLGDMIALKVAAGRWRRSEKSMRKLAQDHSALHRIGGRLVVDDAKLRAGVFGHVFPLSS